MDILTGLLWLTLNVYHEARGEPVVGQMAVALVTINRTHQRNLPIKEVVLQHRQFAWTYRKKSYFPEDFPAFLKCFNSVYLALQSEDFTEGATHFHNISQTPYWTKEMTVKGQYGRHIFYQ
jgi:N-acetylmuramoyl-L-alanine amidase